MISLLGINDKWEIEVYGIFKDIDIKYPLVEIKEGVINLKILRDKLIEREREDPFYYINKYVVVRVDGEDIRLLRMELRSIKIGMEYKLESNKKNIEVKGLIDSLLVINKGIGVDRRVYAGIKELIKPPTIIDINKDIFIFKDGKYIKYED